MKRLLILLLVPVLLCAFAGCGNGVNTAEKPCVLVGGTVYYMSGEKAADALPEGYLSAGRLEGVKDFPRADMTGLVPDGSEVYVSEEKPEAVYVRMSGGYACFTVEKLQYAWLRVNGILYLREEDYRKAYPDSPAGSFDGSLPAGAEYRGNLRSFVPDAFPAKDFETNFKTFVGYAVYALPDEPEAVFLRNEPGTSDAIRFLRDPEEAPAETPAAEMDLYARFFAEAKGENLTWVLEDARGWELQGSWAEHPFPLPPAEGYDWKEAHYTVPEDTVDPGFAVHFSFQWSLTITDEARDASVAYYGDTHHPMNIIRCTEGEEIRYYRYELPEEERDPNTPPDNQAVFWTLVSDAAAEAREAVAGHLEQEPKRELYLFADSLLEEAVAKEYIEEYTRPFTEALLGNHYAAWDVESEIEVLEGREDGNAFIFRARLGFRPRHWGWFNACMGGDGAVWKEAEKRLYITYCFCLEKRGTIRPDTSLPQLWKGMELPELEDYETYVAQHGSWFASHMSPKADKAIRSAVLAHNRDGNALGEFPCESHMLIAMSETAGPAGDTAAVTYYLMVDYREYDETEEGFTVVAGSCVPCILTFDVDGAGDHTLTEYWEPRDGDVFAQLVQRFPGDLTEEELDTQDPKYRNTLPAACDAQAEVYFSVDREQRQRQALAAALREDHPYHRDTMANIASFSLLFPDGDWLRYGDFAFRAEVTGDWETLSRTLSPSGRPGDGLDTVVDTYMLPVKVTEWLDSRDGIELPEGPLWLAWTYVTFDFADREHFPVGASFVFCGNPSSGLKEYHGQPVVSSSTLVTFYVTEDEHILAFDREPAMDAYSGYSYAEFRDALRQVARISGWHG